MAIHIENAKDYILNNPNESRIQSLPFKIQADCDANVAAFFETTVRKEENYVKASFRGYPLQGQTVSLPEGYVGVVLHESIAPSCENQDRQFRVVNKFKSIKYWNWDKIPSQNDKIVQALDWLDIAEALHSPIVED